MKKFVLSALLMCLTVGVFAQFKDAKTIEREAEDYFGKDLVLGAETIKTYFPLTSSGITLNTSISVPNSSKDEIFKTLREYLCVEMGGEHFAYENKEDGILDITMVIANFGMQKINSSTKAYILLPATLRYIVENDSVKISCSFHGYQGAGITKEKKKGGLLKKIGGIASSVGVLGIAGGALGGAAGVVSAGSKVANIGTMAGAAGNIQNIVTGTGGSYSLPSVSQVDWEISGAYPFSDSDENKEISAKLLCMSIIEVQNTLARQCKSIKEVLI